MAPVLSAGYYGYLPWRPYYRPVYGFDRPWGPAFYGGFRPYGGWW